MKMESRIQLVVGLLVVVLGGGVLGGEYFLVKWYPRHEQQVHEDTLKLLPYRNDSLGIELEVAAGLYGKVEGFPGGVRITRPEFWRIPAALTITAQPNPDGTFEFSPQILAKWQTQGTYEDIPRYHFEHTKINKRDAVLIWQYKDRAMLLTVRVISSDRLVELYCTPGREDEPLFMQACESSVHTLKVAGPEPPAPPSPILELAPPVKRPKPAR
jgi:hypothetical protein